MTTTDEIMRLANSYRRSSQFDVGVRVDALRVAVSALVAERDALRAALNVIASWNEGDEVGSGFDEPWSAKTARAALKGKP